jgi:hypothetical protein
MQRPRRGAALHEQAGRHVRRADTNRLRPNVVVAKQIPVLPEEPVTSQIRVGARSCAEGQSNPVGFGHLVMADQTAGQSALTVLDRLT